MIASATESRRRAYIAATTWPGHYVPKWKLKNEKAPPPPAKSSPCGHAGSGLPIAAPESASNCESNMRTVGAHTKKEGGGAGVISAGARVSVLGATSIYQDNTFGQKFAGSHAHGRQKGGGGGEGGRWGRNLSLFVTRPRIPCLCASRSLFYAAQLRAIFFDHAAYLYVRTYIRQHKLKQINKEIPFGKLMWMPMSWNSRRLLIVAIFTAQRSTWSVPVCQHMFVWVCFSICLRLCVWETIMSLGEQAESARNVCELWIMNGQVFLSKQLLNLIQMQYIYLIGKSPKMHVKKYHSEDFGTEFKINWILLKKKLLQLENSDGIRCNKIRLAADQQFIAPPARFSCLSLSPKTKAEQTVLNWPLDKLNGRVEQHVLKTLSLPRTYVTVAP